MWLVFVLILVLTAPEIDSKDGDLPDIPIPPEALETGSKDGDMPDIPIPPEIDSKDGDPPNIPMPIPPETDSKDGDIPDISAPPGIHSKDRDLPAIPISPKIDSRVGDPPDIPNRVPRCADNHESCQAWAENNMCFTNAKFMLKNCKKSCKVCSGRTNTFPSKQCEEWAKNGNCDKGAHVDWMHENCARSCDCVDKFITSIGDVPLCVFAAESGLCDNNKARNTYLRENCKRSCGLCPQEKCVDAGGDSAACQQRAKSGQCLKYPDWMNKNCRKSCGNCLVHGKSYRVYRKNKPKLKPTSNSISNAESCGRFNHKVVGGQDSVPGAWPWQVLIMHKTRLGKVHCGGVLINKQWVLTASHCFRHPKSRSIRARHIKVRLAEHDLTRKSGNELDLDVVKLVRHENFTYDTHDNDIALLKLARPVELDMLTRPACLPERFSNEIPDKECFVTGWGKLSVDGETATKLQVAKVPIIDNSVCKKVMKLSHATITKNMVCAGYFWKEIDTCSGDSGGPLVCKKGERFELIGLTSYGKGCAQKKTYGVYTKVSHYVDWISHSIQQDDIP